MPMGRNASTVSSSTVSGSINPTDGVQRAEAAAAALRGLDSPNGGPPGATNAAIAAMQVLILRVNASADSCAKLARAAGDLAESRLRTEAAIGEVEKSIIESKMELGSLLEKKDIIAGEIWKAKKELAQLSEIEEEEAKLPSEGKNTKDVENDGDPGATGTDPVVHSSESQEAVVNGDEAMTETLEKQTRDELAQLAKLDSEIVDVTDQMNTIRKRRAFLEEKLSTAYNEF